MTETRKNTIWSITLSVIFLATGILLSIFLEGEFIQFISVVLIALGAALVSFLVSGTISVKGKIPFTGIDNDSSTGKRIKAAGGFAVFVIILGLYFSFIQNPNRNESKKLYIDKYYDLMSLSNLSLEMTFLNTDIESTISDKVEIYDRIKTIALKRSTDEAYFIIDFQLKKKDLINFNGLKIKFNGSFNQNFTVDGIFPLNKFGHWTPVPDGNGNFLYSIDTNKFKREIQFKAEYNK